MGNLNCCSRVLPEDPVEEQPNARAEEENPPNAKGTSSPRGKGFCLKGKKRKIASQSDICTLHHTQTDSSMEISIRLEKRSHRKILRTSYCSEDSMEDVMEEYLRDRVIEENPYNAEVSLRANENELQEHLIEVLPRDQEDDEVPHKAKGAVGAREKANPEALLEETPRDRTDEEIPSNSKVTSGASKNTPPEGLLEELPNTKGVEQSPCYSKLAQREHNNDWLADRRYDWTSSEEDDNPGRSQ
ncbi:uncharacterized protein [Dasypus novemcinctus]|uniref:uncharacterized protein n=1 Tax=Dasypus novemcinctus TaxID=9361 RepID=UPI0026601A72|nr:uncharacterized protein LOC131274594 [Dasypus novemcinctus]